MKTYSNKWWYSQLYDENKNKMTFLQFWNKTMRDFESIFAKQKNSQFKQSEIPVCNFSVKSP